VESRRPVNILLVDDQPAKLLSYETILEELGENLIRASSGKEALELLLKTEIAVVLVDVCMPELDGFELASLIRSHPRYQKTAIILVSGVLVEDRDRLKGYDSGAVDYVSVPIIPEILRAKVSVFAELYRKNDELQRLNRELERRVAERTAQIEAAAALLRQNQERLRLVLTSSRIRGWTWDVLGNRVMRVSPTGETEAVLGTLSDYLTLIHAEDRPAVRGALETAVATTGEYQTEFRLIEDGEERWMLGRGTVIRDDEGRALSVTGIGLDITDRKRAEEERAMLLRHAQEARRDAEVANQLKDEFLATLSHELRTPLNAITGWAHLLKAGPLDDATFNRAVETICRNANLQTQLISDILDVSRIITGKLRLNLEFVHLPGLIEAALDTVRPAAAAKGITLEADLDGEGEPYFGDPARLQQVVWNLLSNAIKFAPQGGHVHIQLKAERSQAEIAVQDDGPGIRPEFLPYVFDRFRQADSSSTRSHHGLGLGLAIVRHLLEMHGGTVHAANRTEGSGAIFRIVLPRRIPEGDATRDAAGSSQVATDRSVWMDAAPSLKGIRILVVDDQADAREVVAAILEHCGAEARVAASAAEAFAMLERERPDVLVADIEMPGENGYSLLRRIRALPTEHGGMTPAVALTAYASTQDRMKVLAAGFQMHVPKPVQPAELATVIASLSGVVVKRAPGREER
jgi:PAS domain S-box-containing protein